MVRDSSTTSSAPASAAGASTTSASLVGWSSVVVLPLFGVVVVVDCPGAPGLRGFLPRLHSFKAGDQTTLRAFLLSAEIKM